MQFKEGDRIELRQQDTGEPYVIVVKVARLLNARRANRMEYYEFDHPSGQRFGLTAHEIKMNQQFQRPVVSAGGSTSF